MTYPFDVIIFFVSDISSGCLRCQINFAFTLSFVLFVIEEMGRITMLFLSVLAWAVRTPLRFRLIIKQMEFVGVKSIFVVVLTGTFTGMVMTQGYHGFKIFSAESLVGSTVALAMTLELGPVLTSLMVTARAGSAMATELGTMRVTEQIDALYVMATNPVKYLIVPPAGMILSATTATHRPLPESPSGLKMTI
jgi:phospholipid/cholesterol/gamma-HCH transport system permease protein